MFEESGFFFLSMNWVRLRNKLSIVLVLSRSFYSILGPSQLLFLLGIRLASQSLLFC